MYEVVKVVQRIKDSARQKGIKTSEMLIACELSKNALSSMSSRGSWIQANSLAKIADYLNVSVDYLLGRTEETGEYNNNINNFDTTVSGTQANVIHKEDDNLNEVKNVLNQLSKANRLRAVADILDLIEEKYLNK